VQKSRTRGKQQKEMSLMTVNLLTSELYCPLCGKSKAKILSEMDSFGFKVRYYLCQTCGFVFQNFRESAAADPAFYAETYRQLYQATEEPTAKDLRQQRLAARGTQ